MQDQAHQKAPSPEEWQAVASLFLKALEFPKADRAAFLDTACVGNSALREELDALLAAHEDEDVFVDEMDAASAAALLHEAHPQKAQTYGAYEVVREIGRGGMGKVYLAERTDGQFSQEVALKVVKGGLDTAGISQRFLQERQILARLQHPNIARLLDGGVGVSGDPYFVMEYIDGQPLLVYCDAERLSLDARLRLFVKVCEAVQYAHQNLVVHRDLKPGNILVTRDGEVKLLDFGIAKLIAAGELGAGKMNAPEPLTETGFKAMTPEYASPEQVRAEAVTTATDVYALGVILYEMLVGCRPYQFDRRSMQDVVQAICINEPVRPLKALDIPELQLAAPDQIASARTLSLPRLRRALKGDIESILLKALQKEPMERYATVQAFREDLDRYLGRMPVESRAGSWGYVVTKFIRRHRLAVAGMSLFVLCLAMFSIVLGIQANRLADERDRSQREAEKAGAVADFLESIFKSTRATVGNSDDPVTAQELLQTGVDRVKSDFAGNPEVQAMLLQVLGRTHLGMNFLEDGKLLVEEALEMSIALEGEESLQTAQNKILLSSALQSLAPPGWQEEARRLYEEALATQRRLGDHEKNIANSLLYLGVHLHAIGDQEAVKETASEALELWGRKQDYTDPAVIERIFQLATLQRYAGETEVAESLYTDAINSIAPTTEALQYQLSLAHTYMASLYFTLRRDNKEKLHHYERAYMLSKDLPGVAYGDFIDKQNSYAVSLAENGETEQAIALLEESVGYWQNLDETSREAYDERERALGLASAEGRLQKVYRLTGEYARAERVLKNSIARVQAFYGTDHYQPRIMEVELAKLLGAQDKMEEAYQVLEGAITALSKQFGKDYLIVSTARSLMASFYMKDGRVADAIALLHEVNAALGKDDGRIPARHLGPVFMLSRAYGEQNMPLRADSLLHKHYDDMLALAEEETAVGIRLKSVIDSLHTAAGLAPTHGF